MEYTKKNVAKMIDHTFLKPDGSLEDISRLCVEAEKYNFASVAIAPAFVKHAADKLKNSDVKVDVAIGFPLGYTTLNTKVFETKDAIKNGATEIDMMVNLSAVKDGKWEEVKKELKEVAGVTGDLIFKIIFETCYLSDSEIERLAKICLEVNGINYIKTSTGFGPEGADSRTVKLMKDVVGNKLKVKASGGISSLKDFKLMVQAGASRIGSSSGIDILKEIS